MQAGVVCFEILSQYLIYLNTNDLEELSLDFEYKFIYSYEWNDDGSLTIFKGKRLAIYNTTVQGQTDYSVEFKSMYNIEDDHFYSIPGGYINIPQAYKSRDKDNNLVVSAEFFEKYPEYKQGEVKKNETDTLIAEITKKIAEGKVEELAQFANLFALASNQ